MVEGTVVMLEIFVLLGIMFVLLEGLYLELIVVGCILEGTCYMMLVVAFGWGEA